MNDDDTYLLTATDDKIKPKQTFFFVAKSVFDDAARV